MVGPVVNFGVKWGPDKWPKINGYCNQGEKPYLQELFHPRPTLQRQVTALISSQSLSELVLFKMSPLNSPYLDSQTYGFFTLQVYIWMSKGRKSLGLVARYPNQALLIGLDCQFPLAEVQRLKPKILPPKIKTTSFHKTKTVLHSPFLRRKM